MKMKILSIAVMMIFLAACKNEAVKIIVYSNSGAVINREAKTITEKENTGHLENTVDYSGKTTVSLTGPSGEKKFDFNEPGYYIINAKAADTIIGGYQKFSLAGEAKRTYTREDIQKSVDSLKSLLAGNTVSGNSPTFFIPPYSSQKITSNTSATMIGPYHKISSIESEDGKEPEVYRFYSIKEVRETLENLEQIANDQAEEQ